MSRRLSKLLMLSVVMLIAAMLVPAAVAKGPPDDPGGHTETVGNNLSYPVIWAEGVTKVLRPAGEGGDPSLSGEWWYQWGTNGTDPDVTPASCPPDPDDMVKCDDGIPGQANGPLPGATSADNPLPLAKAYLQKDADNLWQAASFDGSASPVHVDLIDWGDNLESVDWYTRSQVRTEVVLFEDSVLGDTEDSYPRTDPSAPWTMREYEMRHTSGWGIDEVHGLALVGGTVSEGPGTRATVYSPCARLTIQKLLVDRDDSRLTNLEWVPEVGWDEPGGEGGLINPAIFNMAVYEGGDGPGYYSAEINVKGRIIYGYTWNVRALNDMAGGTAAGDYRITFSFDEGCPNSLNTSFVEGITEIMVPIEVDVVDTESEPGGGAEGVLVPADNLTYMDVRILERGGGGGGGGGGNPGGGGRR